MRLSVGLVRTFLIIAVTFLILVTAYNSFALATLENPYIPHSHMFPKEKTPEPLPDWRQRTFVEVEVTCEK